MSRTHRAAGLDQLGPIRDTGDGYHFFSCKRIRALSLRGRQNLSLSSRRRPITLPKLNLKELDQ